jgi:hypothetical protein
MDDVTIIPPNASGNLDEPRSLAIREQPRAVNPITSIRLLTIGDIMQFAEHAARSQLVPDTYRGKPDDIVIAVMQGAELGLPPIQALNSIAVINGRPSVWGDAVPGLCYASGKVEDIEEHFEGSPGQDDYTAICIAKRRGVPSPKIGRFSQGDAKVAGLFGKATHGKYPGRMMMWRARHFALHDAFPDVLRGIGTRELDAEDMEANAGPRWNKAMPEQQSERKPGVQADGWDDTWFVGIGMKLQAEQNAWKWMQLLIAALGEAPSKRDLDELADRPDVQNTRANAPDEAKQKIDLAFNKAMERFKTPIAGAAERSKKKSGVKIEAVLVDQYGEIHGEFDDPNEFATAFVDLYMTASDDASREALDEHNQDALEEAINASADAAATLETIKARKRVEPKSQETRLEPPVVNAKSSWPGYLKLLKETLPTVGADRFAAWADVQYDVLKHCPTAQRALAIRAISEAAGRLSVPQPTWLSDLVKPKPVAATPAPTTATAQAQPDADAYAPGGGKTLSVDERWVDEQIAEVHKVKTQAEFDAMMTSTALRTRMSRLRRENEPLFERADLVFAAKMAEVRGK